MRSVTTTFRDAFYAALRSDELGDRPIARTIAGVALVLFRDHAGVARALQDRCAHRGVPLSKGRVVDGCVRCPYHGWRYGGDGRCTEIPELPPDQRIPARTSLASFETREQHGWVFVKPSDAPPRWPIPRMPELDDPRFRACVHAREIDCDWPLMVENVLDGAHLPLVHEGSLDRSDRMYFDWSRPFRRGRATPGEYTVEERPWGFLASTNGIDDERLLGFRFRVQLPSTVTVELDFDRKAVRVFVHVVPIAPGRCRVEHAIVRNFLTTRLVDPIFLGSARRILREDAEAVELSQRAYESEGDAFETSTVRDRLALQFRKLIRHEVDHDRHPEGADADGRHRRDARHDADAGDLRVPRPERVVSGARGEG